jgi:hypothetical protein
MTRHKNFSSTISCVTFFGLKPSAADVDLPLDESLAAVEACQKRTITGERVSDSSLTRGCPTEDNDNDCKSDNSVYDLAHRKKAQKLAERCSWRLFETDFDTASSESVFTDVRPG